LSKKNGVVVALWYKPSGSPISSKARLVLKYDMPDSIVAFPEDDVAVKMTPEEYAIHLMLPTIACKYPAGRYAVTVDGTIVGKVEVMGETQ
jgi:hypothetical protein